MNCLRSALTALLLGALLLVPGLSGHADAAPSVTSTAVSTVSLGGVTVRLRPGTTQVVTVNHTTAFHARLSLWVRGANRWHRKLTTTDGRIGYGGLVAGGRRHQGTGATPLGTYGLISAFGTHRDAATGGLPYRRIHRGDYWVEDNASPYYNRYRNKAQGGFRWWLPLSDDNGSERLSDFPRQYEEAIVLDYNQEQVRHRGAGIFLHVNGRGATAGCVSAPRSVLTALMHRLDPARVPVIAIGR